MNLNEIKSYIVYLSTYPPRECGIATFTKDLTVAMDKIINPKFKSKIIALNDKENFYNYSNDVLYQINHTDVKSYIEVAQKINENDNVKAVSIQHEFNIFGSYPGEKLLEFLKHVKKPVITTLHTVSYTSSDSTKRIMKLIAEYSKKLIVMNDFAIEILNNDYGIDKKKICVIHHGIHEVPYELSVVQKTKLGYEDKLILSSFGLLSGSKNFESIVDSLPEVVKKFPNVLYLIIGKTHPVVLKKEGEKYRDYLKIKIKNLGLQDNVKFINKYMELKELLQYLRASDIFVSSGLGLSQIVSGTLSYAMGCGRPVITIPFLHAKEAVTPDRGILVEINDSKAYTKAIIRLLSDPALREQMGKNVYEYTRHMLWKNVANSYMKVFSKYLTQ